MFYRFINHATAEILDVPAVKYSEYDAIIKALSYWDDEPSTLNSIEYVGKISIEDI